MEKTPLFHADLEKEMATCGKVKQFPAGTVILEEAHSIRSIPLVLKGSLRVMRTDEDGREILLYYIQPGESCIMSFLGGFHHETSKVSAVVEEDAELLLIPIDKASDWVKVFPEWTDFIFKLYHKRFEELLAVVNAMAFQHLDDRLLALLKQKAHLVQSPELKITHQQLAGELGSTREVISRLLKQMENQGVVTLHRNKLVLR